MAPILIALAAQALAANTSLYPYANEFFDRDSELKSWALRFYDTNRDGWLTLYEAQPAVRAFKEIADSNRDGRVTTYEYARAKEFIVARW